MATLHRLLRVFDPSLKYTPEYKQGEIDGYVVLLSEDGKFYTGLLPNVIEALNKKEIPVELDNTHYPQEEPISLDFGDDLLPGIVLRNYQTRAIQKGLYKKRGIIRIPTGGGKSEVMIGITKVLDKKTLVLVNNSNLLVQTTHRFLKYGLTSIGIISGDLDSADQAELASLGVVFWDSFDSDLVRKCKVVLGMTQSIYAGIRGNDQEMLDYLRSVEVLHLDEVHNSPAMTWRTVVSRCHASYRLGYSATPFRSIRESLHPRDLILIGLTGEVIFSVDYQYLVANNYIANPKVYLFPVTNQVAHYNNNWPRIYKHGIEKNEFRNELIAKVANELWIRWHKIYVPVKHVQHGKRLLGLFYEKGIESYLSIGGQQVFEWSKGKVKKSKFSPKQLHDYISESERVLMIGSTNYKEGIDMPGLTAGILAAGGRSFIDTVQRTGRLVRGSGSVILIDFMDMGHRHLQRHSFERKQAYLDMGWEVHDANVLALV